MVSSKIPKYRLFYYNCLLTVTANSAEFVPLFKNQKRSYFFIFQGSNTNQKKVSKKYETFSNHFQTPWIFHKTLPVLFQIFLHVIVVSSDVKIIVVFPPAGIAMATKIARMAQTKPIAPPSLAQKTNLSVPRAAPTPHPSA